MSNQVQKQHLSEKMEIQNQNNYQQQPLSNSQLNQIQQNLQGLIQYQDLNEQQYEKYAEEVEQNSQRVIQRVQYHKNTQDRQEEEVIQPMKNPVSAYLIFTMKWKAQNPDKKFSMSLLGELWKNLQSHEKRQFEEQYRRQKQKYDLYVASKLIKNPNADKEEDVENKFFFPLHRIKSIMKQDKFYAPKTQAVAAMGRATQYFGEYFLEELKKITEGKNRIDTKDLFQCITVNQRTFGFLDCLIDDYAESTKEKKTTKPIVEQQEFKEKQTPAKESNSPQKKRPGRQPNQTSNVKALPKGQTLLTDMFTRK